MKKIFLVFLSVLFLLNAMPLSLFAMETEATEDIATEITTETSELQDETEGANEEVAESSSEYPYLVFMPLDDGTYSVSVGDAAVLPTELVIPSTYNGAKVTQIARNAFSRCDALISVTIPNTVFIIHAYAFESCKNLETVIFEENSSLIQIIGWAFQGCDSLTSMTLPASLIYINGQAFAWGCTNLSLSVEEGNEYYQVVDGCLMDYEGTLLRGTPDGMIPEGTKTIGIHAFSGFEFESISIPASVEVIDSDGFSGCWGLKELVIPEGVREIHREAFSFCGNLVSVTIPASVRYIDRAFAHCGANLTSINVSENNDYYKMVGGCLVEIESGLLIHALDTVIEIPDCVKAIGPYAFQENPIASIVIPARVISIGENAFLSCEKLEEITFAENSELQIISMLVFQHCYLLESVTIPSSVHTIEWEIFCNSGVTTVYCETYSKPDGWVDEWCYNSDDKVVQVIWKEASVDDYLSFTLLEDGTYSVSAKNTSLVPKNLVIPSEYNGIKVTEIGYRAFNWCEKLTTVYIPASVTNIYADTFTLSPLLSNIIVAEDNVHYQSIDGCLVDSTGTVLIQGTCKGIIPDGVEVIGEYAFAYYEFEHIKFPNSVTIIGREAFSFCENLKEVVIPASVTTIEKRAFSGCTNLVIICEAEFKPDGWADAWADNVNTIIWGGEISIENYMEFVLLDDGTYSVFAKNTSLVPKNLVIPSEYNGIAVTEIGDSAFQLCPLVSVTIPKTVTVVRMNAFSMCSYLEEVIFEDGSSLNSILGSAFFHCTSLQSITIPESVEGIYLQAFSFTALETITIPANVRWMFAPFAGCENLKNIVVDANNAYYKMEDGCLVGLEEGRLVAALPGVNTIPYSVRSLDESVFNNSAITSITIPSSVVKIGATAFICSSLKTLVFEDGSGLIEIGSQAFAHCYSLNDIVIPASVRTMGSQVFNSTNLNSIYCEVKSQPAGWDSAWVDNINWTNGVNITWGATEVPETPVENYLAFTLLDDGTYSVAAKDGAQIPSNLVIPAEYNDVPVTVIAENGFHRCTSLVSVTIPATIEIIDYRAFDGCYSLEAVIFEENSMLQIIGPQSFSNAAIESFFVPENVYEILGSAFGRTDLKTFVVHANNQNFAVASNGALVSANGDVLVRGLNDGVVPDGVTTIKDGAFDRCSFTTVTIPNSVTCIESHAFAASNRMTALFIPASVIETGESIVLDCPNVTVYCEANEKPANWATNWYWNVWEEANVTTKVIWGTTEIPAPSVEDYLDFALLDDGTYRVFAKDRTLLPASLTIPSTYDGVAVTEILWGAFQECYTLKEIILPATIRYVDGGAFIGCEKFEGFIVDENNRNYKAAENGALVSKNGAVLVCGLNDGIIPDGVKTIGWGAFDCVLATEIIIPEGVECIQEQAFRGSWNLETLVIPASVKEIGSLIVRDCPNVTVYCAYVDKLPGWADDWCQTSWEDENAVAKVIWGDENPVSLEDFLNFSLVNGTYRVSVKNPKLVPKNLVIPSEYSGIPVTNISSLRNCPMLETVTIPASVTKITGGAFAGCNNLYAIYVDENNEYYSTASNGALLNKDGNTLIQGLNDGIIPDGVKVIGGNAFLRGTFDTIVFSESVEEIRCMAFQQCKNLISVTLPETIVSVEGGAFMSCVNLQAIYISEGHFAYKTAENGALLTADGSTLVQGISDGVIPNGVKVIGESAFDGLSNITDIIIHEGVEVIGDNAFWGCKIAQIEIPESVHTIGGGAFAATLITKITIPASVQTMGYRVFQNCAEALVVICEASSKPENWEEDWCWNASKENLVTTQVYWTPEGSDDTTGVVSGSVVEGVAGGQVVIPIQITNNPGFTMMRVILSYDSNVLTPAGVNDFGLLGKGIHGVDHNNDSVVLFWSNPLATENYDANGVIAEVVFDVPSEAPTGESVVAITVANGDVLDAQMNPVSFKTEDAVLNILGVDSYLNFTWNSKEKGWNVSAKDQTLLPENLIIPASFNGDKVVGVSAYGFNDCDNLKSVVIPNTVKTIETWAFNHCDNLTEVVFEANSVLKKIGDSTFRNTPIENITIPASVTDIGDSAFCMCYRITSFNVEEGNKYYTSIDGYLVTIDGKTLLAGINVGATSDGIATIPDGVEYIAEGAMGGRDCIKVVLPESMKTIGFHAFRNCTKLRYLHIPVGVEEIRESAFFACSNLNDITVSDDSRYFAIENGCLIEKESKTLIFAMRDYFTTIPSNIKRIAMHAFMDHEFKEIVIPVSVEEIGSNAFLSCENLASVIFEKGSNLAWIEDYAFHDCFALREIDLPAGIQTIDREIFLGCKDLTVNCKDASKPDGWRDDWYWNANDETKVTTTVNWTLDESGNWSGLVSADGVEAYAGAEISVPLTMENNPGFATMRLNISYDPTKLTLVGVKDYGMFGKNLYGTDYTANPYTMLWSNPLETANFKENGVFATLIFKVLDPKVAEDVTTEVVVTFESGDALDVRGNEKDFDTANATVVIKNNYTEKDYLTFTWDDLLNGWSVSVKNYGLIPGKLVIPSEYTDDDGRTGVVVHIGKHAFKDCLNLQDVTVPESVIIVEEDAFADCDNLNKIRVGYKKRPLTWHENWNRFGEKSFDVAWGKTNIRKDVPIEYYLTFTPNGDAYSVSMGRCEWLLPENLTIPSEYNGKTVIKILETGFQGCNKLKRVTIPAAIKEVGANAFSDCSSLKFVTMEASDAVVGNGAFANCGELKHITLRHKGENMKNWFGEGKNPSGTIVINFANKEFKKDEFAEHFGKWVEFVSLVPTEVKQETVADEEGNEQVVEKVVAEVQAENIHVSEEVVDKTTNETKKTVVIDVQHVEEKAPAPDTPEGGEGEETKTADLKATDVAINKDVVQNVKGSEATVKTSVGTIVFDKQATETFGEKASDMDADVKLTLSETTSKKEKEEGTKVISITLTVGEGEYAENLLPKGETNGTITITITYEKGLDINNIVINYRDGKEREAMEIVSYDPVTGELSFNTTHFSEYEVLQKDDVLKGDLNEDGVVNSDDAIYLLFYTFDQPGFEVSQSVDFDGNGKVNSDDAIYLLFHTFDPEGKPLL